MTLIFNNLTLGYDRHPAVHHLDGRLEEGKLLALVGPNGGGKTTLLKAIAGLIKPLNGSIDFQGLKPRDIAYLPQQSEIDRSFPITVYDLVATGFIQKLGFFSKFTKSHQQEISEAIIDVGLEGFEHRRIGTLSGGQLQRALFARLLLQDAALILLDEPFGAIDSKTVEDLWQIIKRWHQNKRSIIIVLHDHHFVRTHIQTTLLLAREMIAWGATDDVLTDKHLSHAARHVMAEDLHAKPCELSH